MATLKWNPNTVGYFLAPGSAQGGLMFSSGSVGSSNSQVLGSTTTATASTLYIFKGTMPSDVNSIANIASISGNLLVALPTFNTNIIGNVNDSYRFFVGSTSTPYVMNNGAITFTGGVMTVVNTGHSFIPGQTVTIAGVSGGANINATWTVETTPNSNAWTTTASTGSNGTASGNTSGGNTTFNYTAQGTGTASWFLLARNGGGNSLITTSTALSSIGALMGNVGVTASGSDLEIPNTTITSGSTYSSAGFYLNWPLTFTV